MPDREKARDLVRTAIDPSVLMEGKCNYDDFSKLFCKGIFKQALMRIAKKIMDHNNKGNGKDSLSSELAEQLPLETKMATFNRQKLLKGLNQKDHTHKEVMRTLGALD